MIGNDAYVYKANKEHLIGEGGFARVFRAIRKHDHQVFAIKRSRDEVEFLEES